MKKYQIIYADPPWKYKNKRTGGESDEMVEDCPIEEKEVITGFGIAPIKSERSKTLWSGVREWFGREFESFGVKA